MTYPIAGFPIKAHKTEAKKEQKPSCPCFGRKVKKVQQHETALSQHEIDFTKIIRKEAFEEKKK